MNQPQTWHYGIMAQHWAEFQNYSGDEPDVAFYQKFIENDGQPALDVGCGTGRLLLPYLRAGLDVDGCDISPDMLAHCQKKAEREGFSPNLYAQAMHELDLPRTYQTIFVCGSFGIGGTRQQNTHALKRFYQHLAPGGTLLFDLHAPYKDDGPWNLWQKGWEKLSSDWWPDAKRERASDGTDFVMRSRIANLDPLDQSLTLQIWAQHWQGKQLLGEEERTLTTNIYFKNELVMMLQQAGFTDITVRGDFTEEEASPKHGELVYIAKK